MKKSLRASIKRLFHFFRAHKPYSIGALLTVCLIALPSAALTVKEDINRGLDGKGFYKQQLDRKELYKVRVEGGQGAAFTQAEKTSSESTFFAYSEAIRECESRLKPLLAKRRCEPVWVDGEPIVTAASLRKRARDEVDSAEKLSLFRVTSPRGVLFLYGSVHLMKKNAYPLHPAVMAAFASSDNLVLEVNLGAIEPQKIQHAFAEKGFYQDGRQLADDLDPDTFSMAKNVLSGRGVKIENYLKMRPWLFEQTIIMQEMGLFGFDSEAGIDTHFEQQATALGKPILQLETLQQQLDLLSSSSLEQQLFSLKYSLGSLQQRSVQEELNALVIDWMQGDVDGLYTYMMEPLKKYPRLAPFMEAMFDDRNRAMSEKIANWLEQGGSYFVVMGAGHLGGPNGVVKLLQNKGYALEQQLR